MIRRIRPSVVGPLLWVLGIQYFITQFVVAMAWAKPYSIANNTISDLGNTACGSYRDSLICSPMHTVMNLSFITLGVLMVAGSLCIYRHIRSALLGFVAMSIAGIGTALVGFFPENTISTLHIVGAALSFTLGNVALILFLSLNIPRVLRYLSITSGIVALVALSLFVSHFYLGLGIGGMERVTAYPQTIWLIIFGIYFLNVSDTVSTPKLRNNRLNTGSQ